MTPTSLLAGVITGLLEGFGVALAVFLVINLVGRRHRPVPVRHPVADDRSPLDGVAYTPVDADRRAA